MVTATAFSFPEQDQQPIRRLTELLDLTMAELASADSVRETMAHLFVGLGRIWSSASDEEWSRIVRACKDHPLYELLDQDPFTRRARSKPRGYAGDAVMIDYIYRGLSGDELGATTELGRQVFECTAGFADGARSVRARRDLLAARIDATARRVARPRILAVAAGHLREGALSKALVDNEIEALYALDQDVDSLDVVKAAYADVPAVHVMPGSVRDLLTGELTVGRFDLVYAAGLYDYLPLRTARSLVALLASRLEAGGELLIGNFLPAPSCVGYMEALMDWPLVWRSRPEVASLASAVPPGVVESIATWTDSTECIAYLRLTRR